MSEERKYKYQHHEPLDVVKPTHDHNGSPVWKSMCTQNDFNQQLKNRGDTYA